MVIVMINFKAIGQRIREERKSKGFTQEQFSEIIGISVEHLSRIETGSYRPSLLLIEKIAEIFLLDEQTLMFGTKADNNQNRIIVEKIERLSKEKKEALSIIIDLIS